MERFAALLLDVWREVCRHIEIEESVPTLARILSYHVPVATLEIVAIEWDRRTIEPRGRARVGDDRAEIPAKRSLMGAECDELRKWFDGWPGTLSPPELPAVPGAALLIGDRGDDRWLVVPLASEQGAAGALLLQAPPGVELSGKHLRMIEYLAEPFSVALENDRRLQELKTLREASEAERRSVLARIGRDDLIETIIGRDGGLRPVMRRVKLVAGSDVPVLILGETGSGKEVIARTIHEQSPRSENPFIRVNCGAIPSELIDSELFGHEKGAFTGATSSRRGWFERADRGTLLLDEIGELPLPAQVRLLRVLQEGRFERVGGERTIRVDVRIIAATHRDLPTLIRQGKFREDLWYRITNFPVLLPPLRDRREDIPALARHFVERAARRFGLRPLALSPSDLDLLTAYAWPGNIRELASVIDRAAILGAGETLEIAKSLGSDLLSDAADAAEPPPPPAGAQIETLDQASRRHIEAALRMTRGRIEGRHGIARLLGVNPHTLRARMRKLGIDWTLYRPADGLD